MRGLEKKECPSITFDGIKGRAIVDVRSPAEFSEAHVKDAVNVPLMSDYQRHIVGRTYRQQSREKAVEKGWEFFEPEVKDFVDKFRKFDEVAVYCWRGGMRSRIVVNLLRLNNINAVQLEGGFKEYMKIVWEDLDGFKDYNPEFIVLFGNAGSRKTELLKELDKKGYPVIDLEGLARHRASVYGAVNLKPRSQKMFSILLYEKLKQLQNEKHVFIEGESNKIGKVFLPKFVSEKIKNDTKISVKAGISTRVAATRKEYFSNEKSIKELYEATARLEKIVGKRNVEMLRKWLDDKEYDRFIEYLLLNYYDRKYVHNKQDYDYDLEIESDDLDNAVKELINFYNSIS